MKKNYLLIFVVMFTFGVTGCKENIPRDPISHTSGSYIRTSVDRNIKLNIKEEKIIKQLIEKDSLHEYQQSKDGFWYAYLNRNTDDTIQKTKEIALSFDIKTLDGQLIYDKSETKPKTYVKGKQNVFSGLRNAINILKPNETAVFLFPSNVAYGYLGDKNKIKPNQSIKVELTIINIK